MLGQEICIPEATARERTQLIASHVYLQAMAPLRLGIVYGMYMGCRDMILTPAFHGLHNLKPPEAEDVYPSIQISEY